MHARRTPPTTTMRHSNLVWAYLCPGQLSLAVVAIAATLMMMPSPCAARSPATTGTSATPPRDLDALLAYAKRHSPAVRVAKAAVTQSRALVAAASPTLPANPVLSAGGGPRLGGGDTGFEFRLGLSQELVVGGQIRQRRRAAAAAVSAAKAASDSVVWRLHVRVHKLFFAVLVANEGVRQAESLLAFATKLRRVIGKQAKVGHTAPMAVLVADTDVASAQENLTLAILARSVAMAQLQTTIGWRGAPFSGLVGTLPATTQTHSADQLKKWMLASHPNLKRLAAMVEVAKQRVVLADRMATPNITVGLDYARESQLGPGNGGAQHVMLATLAIPLRVSRKNQGPRARARADVIAAKAQLKAEQQRLVGQLRVGMLRLSAAEKRVRLYSSTVVPALNRNLKLLLKAYKVGEVNFNTVSLTRQRLLRATERYIDARRRYFVASAGVEGVVGRHIFYEKGKQR